MINQSFLKGVLKIKDRFLLVFFITIITIFLIILWLQQKVITIINKNSQIFYKHINIKDRLIQLASVKLKVFNKKKDMLIDILFVVAVIAILIAIYKTKFAQKKSVE